MRPRLLVPWLLLVACDEAGVIRIDEPDGLVDTEVAGVDTEAPADTDLDPVDTEAPVDTDPVDTLPVDTDPGTPFDAPRLAWDGRVVHEFVGYVGAPYGCKATLIEQGEEVTTGAVMPGLRASCPSCTRFFQVRIQKNGVLCLEDWGDVEWRGIELRPTGTVKVVEIYTGGGGGPVPREAYPNATLTGDTLTWRLNRSGFPIYQTEKVRGVVTLTPVP